MTKYAVILCDLNSSELGDVLSTHRTEAAAIKAQPDLPGAYVAHRKPDGEWERRLEARDRREMPPSLGRPATIKGKPTNVYLDEATKARAIEIGGSVSEGVRIALAAYKVTSPHP